MSIDDGQAGLIFELDVEILRMETDASGVEVPVYSREDLVAVHYWNLTDAAVGLVIVDGDRNRASRNVQIPPRTSTTRLSLPRGQQRSFLTDAPFTVHVGSVMVRR